MPTLREYAIDAWSREDEKQKTSAQKKRKRQAKKIEEEIEELLPRELKADYERNLEDATFGVVVSVVESDGTFRFTHDDKDNLVIIGECPQCHREALSRHIDELEDLGHALQDFEAGSSHSCTTKEL
jgi:hypothetical protein